MLQSREAHVRIVAGSLVGRGTTGGPREGCTCIITFQSPGVWPRDTQEPPSRRALHPELPEVREARLEARGPSSSSSFA